MKIEEYVSKQGRNNEYELGLQLGLDIAVEFCEWVAFNGYIKSDFAWYNENGEHVCMDTTQLLELFLNTKQQ